MTARQLQLLRFICGFYEAKGFAPSFAQMRDALGYPSKPEGSGKQTVYGMLTRLEEDGHIVRRRYRSGRARDRGIEIWNPVSVPRDPNGKPLYFVTIGEAGE